MWPLVEFIERTITAELSRPPFQRDRRFLQWTLPLTQAVNWYFDAEVRGWDNLPKYGPFLIVGNHSGGAETMDVAPLLGRWMQERGPDAPLYMLGYDLLLAYPLIGELLRKLGLVPANPGVARRALQQGAAVLVFPGGDYEVFRPWRERNKIQFGGHSGFIELALSARVPVVPMTIHGAHQSTIVLTRGHHIAEAMGLPRLRIKVFPLIWNIPWGVTPAFIPSMLLPSKVTVELGKPLDWSRYGVAKCTDPAVLRKCYDEITGVMQTTLDALAREHPYPVLTRLNELRPSRILNRLLQRTDGRAIRTPVLRRQLAESSSRMRSRHSSIQTKGLAQRQLSRPVG